ncbi:probable disease resistance protein At1g61300 [Neltuma alba]|uniref:probable disease resistance protein At1g61300 n=1 Tax=Neltuma alba TaxID=207710 RepID=UPI0010A55D6E|nr:probable disease resistance protein At1g61300 [Prosopis alba]
MEKLGDIIWDITKYLCGCAKQETEFIYKLEENVQALKIKWEKLEARKKDVEEQIEKAEGTGEEQRTHEVNLWLQRVHNIQKSTSKKERAWMSEEYSLTILLKRSSCKATSSPSSSSPDLATHLRLLHPATSPPSSSPGDLISSHHRAHLFPTFFGSDLPSLAPFSAFENDFTENRVTHPTSGLPKFLSVDTGLDRLTPVQFLAGLERDSDRTSGRFTGFRIHHSNKHCVLIIEVEDNQVQGAQEIQNKCLSKCCPKNCKSSYKVGKNVAKILTEVDDLTAEGQRFGKDYPITHKPPHKGIGQIPLDETVGQDLIFDQVWSRIEANNVGVIGLYGTGGVGKTTLLKKISNELGKRKPDFLVIWVVVSKELDLDAIMDNIRKSVGIGDVTWSSCNNQEEKSSKIWGVLKQKKFALLLDDMWERLDLNLVGVPHPKDSNFESKVLFTTRLEDVCAKMQAPKPLKVDFLNEKEALELFHMKVGEETLNSHPRIKDLAKEMAAECRGLPLALIVVGLAMAGVKDVKAWESSKNNLTSSPWTTTDLDTKFFSILKLSYDQLPDDTHRNCFLYCALYPEDYEIQVTDIIYKWIGEGFICKGMTQNIQDIRNNGQSVITKLKLCCLLESVEDDVVLSRSFKMHDMIREMALWLSCEKNKRIKRVLVQEDAITTSHDDVEKWRIVERISIMNREVRHVAPVTYPNLVTLLLRRCRIQHLQNLKCMSKLKVLELRCPDICELAEIGELVLLEYLCLNIDGSECPKELKNLKNLKVFNLHLSDGNIASIPSGVISSLQQLRVLRVYCRRGVRENSEAEGEFLEEVESLPKIEEINVAIETENGLKKLLQSDKLLSCIYAVRLHELDTIEMPLLLACISKMKRLQQLALLQLSGLKDYSGISDDTYCLGMLQSVFIAGCHSLMHVTWLKHAPLLQLLVITECPSVEEVIKEDENEDSSSVFSSLVNLYLYGMPKLQSIHKTALSFPSLKTITIAECPNLKRLPLPSNSAKQLIIRGHEDWWNSLEWDAKHNFQSKFQPLTSDDLNINFQDWLPAVGLDFLVGSYSFVDFTEG